MGLVPDHRNRVNIIIKQVIGTFWCPSVCKSYVYTILWSIKYAIAFMSKKCTCINLKILYC